MVLNAGHACGFECRSCLEGQGDLVYPLYAT